MCKVLIIAYPFPPMGGSGVQRTVKFAKYLPEYGWQPIILTVSNPPLVEADHTLLEELPSNLPVFRASEFHPLGFGRRTVKGLVSPNGRRPEKINQTFSKPLTPTVDKRRKAWSSFKNTWFHIPDPFIYWFPAALWTGLKIIQQCDVIYSTASPFTDHLVAYFLHKLSGKPWIADYRDPWTQYVVFQRSSSKLRARIDTFFEKLLLKAPDIVSVTCPATAQSFQDTYPSLPKEKFIVITNGFDAEDFKLPAPSLFEKFTIVYTGRFHSEKNSSSPFLQALKELRHEHPELNSKMQVIFAGLFGGQNQTLLQQWGLEEMVKPLGYVPHQEGIELLLKSHVLLLTLNDELGVNLTYPGKLFEYLAAQKTILALVPEGATAELIRDMKAGLVLPPNDVGAIKGAIIELYHKYKQGDDLSKSYDNLQGFERRTLTGQLATYLDALVQERDRLKR